MSVFGNLGGGAEIKKFSCKRANIRKRNQNSQVLREIYSKFITFCKFFDTKDRIIFKLAQFFVN